MNHDEFEIFLHIITNVANNHHRETDFFAKLERILNNFKNQIKQKFTNKEIFDIFASNKRLLLFMIKEEIITLDENIINLIKLKEESNSIKYSDFFIPEIKKVTKNDDDKNFDLNEYEKNRQLGENDSYICSLIRQDSVEEFIAYVNKSHIKLTSKIKPSIFEIHF